jgi:hypothetical protein
MRRRLFRLIFSVTIFRALRKFGRMDTRTVNRKKSIRFSHLSNGQCNGRREFAPMAGLRWDRIARSG